MRFVSLITIVSALASAGAAASAQQPGSTQPADSAQRHDSATVRLPPVQVRASIVPTAGPAVGSTVPARISVISGRELDAWQPHLLVDVLGSRAGVSLYDDLGSPFKLNLSTRGFTAGPTVGLPSGVSVFLDGVRQNEPDAQEVNFDLLPMEHVERVELLSGTASLLGPNSLGGAINLITRRGAGPPHGALELSTGSFGSRAAQASLDGSVHDSWDYYAGGDYGREGGWRESTSARNYSGLLNLGHHTGARGLTLQAFGAKSRAATAGSLPESILDISPRTNFTAGDFEDLDAAQLSLGGYAPAWRGHGSFSVYTRRSRAERFNVNQPPDDNVRSRTINQTLGGSADWRWSTSVAGGALAFRIGADGATNQVHVRIFADPTAGAPLTERLTTDVQSPSWDLAEYAIADLQFGRIALSGGARYDYVRVPFRNALDPATDTTSRFRRLAPRVGVSIDLGGGGMAYASAGQSFRAPAILELACADPEAACPLPFALGDDPPLRPVLATTYELGSRWARGPLQLDGSIYRTEVHDEIFFIASDEALLSGYFTNLPHTRRAGAELAARFQTLDDRVVGYANYAYTHATFQTSAELFSIRNDSDFAASPFAGPNAVEQGDRIPLTPNHQVKVGALVRLPHDVEFGLDSRFIGTQWLRGDEANETRPLRAYAVTNARLGVEHDQWEVTLFASNLFDSHRATFGTFNENRRTGELERFLTPLNARSLRIAVRRRFGGDRPQPD